MPGIVPGLRVQFPAGRPLSSTLPVADAQVGCVIVPTVGTTGNEFTVIAYPAETGPFPHALVPSTVKLPEVAFEAKFIVIEFVDPEIVAPVPEYVQV
jgi:hypothetical protein